MSRGEVVVTWGERKRLGDRVLQIIEDRLKLSEGHRLSGREASIARFDSPRAYVAKDEGKMNAPLRRPASETELPPVARSRLSRILRRRRVRGGREEASLSARGSPWGRLAAVLETTLTARLARSPAAGRARPLRMKPRRRRGWRGLRRIRPRPRSLQSRSRGRTRNTVVTAPTTLSPGRRPPRDVIHQSPVRSWVPLASSPSHNTPLIKSRGPASHAAAQAGSSASGRADRDGRSRAVTASSLP